MVNDQMGGSSQLVGLVAAGLTILFLMFLTPLLAPLPTVVLGAIIIVSALGLIEIEAFRFLRRVRRSEFTLAIVTLLGVLIVGILPGVLVAVTLSLVNVLYRIARPHIALLDDVTTAGGVVYRDIEDGRDPQAEPGLIVYRFDAPLIFANAPYLAEQVRAMVARCDFELKCIILDADAISDVDTTSLEMLEALSRELKQGGIALWLARASLTFCDMLEASGVMEAFVRQHVYPSVRAAVLGYSAEFGNAVEG